jgi:hypothetical protein
VEQAAGHDEVLGRRLDVQDSCSGCHPLGGAVLDQPTATVGILVLELPVDHVGDGFEAPMRMPRRAFRLARCVLDLSHLIHVNERIEIGQAHACKRASDRESFAFEAARRHGHVTCRSQGGRVYAGQARECLRIGGNCRHQTLRSTTAGN